MEAFGTSLLQGALARANGSTVDVLSDANGQATGYRVQTPVQNNWREVELVDLDTIDSDVDQPISSIVEEILPSGKYSRLDDLANTYNSIDGKLRADENHPQQTGSFVREPGKNPINENYQISSLQSAVERNQQMISEGYVAAWREGGTVETGTLMPGEKIYMIVDDDSLKKLQDSAARQQPLNAIGRWSSEGLLPDIIQPSRDVTAVKQEWKDENVSKLYIVELEVKTGTNGVPTRRGENGAVYDDRLNRSLQGGVIQHELFNKEAAANNLQLNDFKKLEENSDD